ncbi:TonB-dependent receptor [Massilia sp. H-1]|nr:TonB-dependent receptor [Massilia sp. H-1]
MFYEVGTRWSAQLRSVAGVRADGYRFQVASDLAANSGRRTAQLISPSLSLVFGPWNKTELYLNAGRGFHSNDARGTTQRIDPASGAPAAPVTPLARATGVELGVRSEAVAGWQSALSLYRLDVASELVFVGDAGTTEAGGGPAAAPASSCPATTSRTMRLTLDADLAFARAFAMPMRPAGCIPGAVEGVASLALALDHIGPWFGALQWRYFGPRPLIEDNAVRSGATSTINGLSSVTGSMAAARSCWKGTTWPTGAPRPSTICTARAW